MERKSILPAVWDVPEIFRQRLGNSVGRQRAMFADGHLLLILHAPPGPEDLERTGRFFWRKPDGTWSSTEPGAGIQALQKHLDSYESLLEALEAEDDAATSSEDYFSIIYRLSPVYRASRNQHQALQQAREYVPEDRDLINFRDRAYKVERTAELLEQDARHSLEFEIARRAEEQAKNSYQMSVSAHRLNVLAAFFFPLVTLCAIFGTNLKHGLEDWPGPYPLIGLLVIGLLMGMFLKTVITRKADISDQLKNQQE
ncbi:MAG: hypothetical protein Tsb009_39200 [Planctomycetaceae bacterium]